MPPKGLAARLVDNKDVLLVLALTAAFRALVCALTNNEWGDPDQRALVAGAWAAAPTLIRTGIWLPLHFYATGLLTFVFGNPIVAGKVLSSVTGTLTVIPLFTLVRRLFDRTTAVVACAYFAVFGNHVGLSSVVMSEAPFALFAVWGLDRFFAALKTDRPRWRGFLAAAVLFAVAGGFRQEAWQLTGILGLYLLTRRGTRVFAVPFVLVGLSSYVTWTALQASAGVPWLHTLTGVGRSKSSEALHLAFSVRHNILKWAWIFVQSPGPIVSGLMAVGLYRSWQSRRGLELASIAILLLGPYVLLSVIKPEWAPQARYAVTFTILLIPYAAYATVAAFERPEKLRWAVTAIVALSIATQMLAYRTHSQHFLPCQDYNANDVAVWEWLSMHTEPHSALIVEDVGWRGPGIVAHANFARAEFQTRPYRVVADYKPAEDLARAAATLPRPLYLVLHSPMSKWEGLLGGVPTARRFENSDYRILEVAAKPQTSGSAAAQSK